MGREEPKPVLVLLASAVVAGVPKSWAGILVSFSCFLTRDRPLISVKSLVSGLFLVEVAGVEPAWAQMCIPTSGPILAAD